MHHGTRAWRFEGFNSDPISYISNVAPYAVYIETLVELLQKPLQKLLNLQEDRRA